MREQLERRLWNHLMALASRKSAIEREINHELRRPLPCSITLQRLKRQRLNLKDRMTSLGTGISAIAHTNGLGQAT